METSERTKRVVNPGTSIGHVHLKVANIERALGFYRDVLGFEVTQWYGDDAVFLSAGGYHHHIGLYPERQDLALALKWLLESNYPIDGASDHGVSEALYLQDPDGNGVELYRDRPQEEWPRTPEGGLAMVTRPLDVEGLLAELDHEETS
jgi:catechol 2,3-dioxygenase